MNKFAPCGVISFLLSLTWLTKGLTWPQSLQEVRKVVSLSKYGGKSSKKHLFPIIFRHICSLNTVSVLKCSHTANNRKLNKAYLSSIILAFSKENLHSEKTLIGLHVLQNLTSVFAVSFKLVQGCKERFWLPQKSSPNWCWSEWLEGTSWSELPLTAHDIVWIMLYTQCSAVFLVIHVV